MFTSRAEYRLMLREDNADLRLTDQGRKLGLVSDGRWDTFNRKREAVAREQERLRSTYVSAHFTEKSSLLDILKRPEQNYASVMALPGAGVATPDAAVAEQVEIQAKYEGYIARQKLEIERRKDSEALALPPELDFREVRGLSVEVQQLLNRHRPQTLGQASRISGVTPAAVSLLLVHLKRGFKAPQKKTA
jgi:tRNA uridine 5-carboxymethylaminomethyl modification enzyme